MTRNEIIISTSLIGIIGLLFLVIPPVHLAKVYFPTIGVSFTIMGVTKLLLTDGTRKDKEFYYNLIEGLIAIIMGIIYVNFYTYLVVDIICFISLAIIPALRLVFAKRIVNQILFDSLKYIGLFSLLGGYIVINDIFFYTCAFIWFGLYFFLAYTYLFVKKNNKEEFVCEED